MKIAFHTLGCKVNQYETEVLCEELARRGHEIVSDGEFADAYVINTCTVTNLADRKSRQFVRRAKKINPEAVVAIIGCYVQVEPDAAAAIEGVNIVAGTNEKMKLADMLEEYKRKQAEEKRISVLSYSQLEDYESGSGLSSMGKRTRPYIKIQEGCNRFCTYCIIPYARGDIRSRAPQDIIREAQRLIDNGFKEIILTGVNTALYGTDEDFKSKYENAVDGFDKDGSGIETIIRLISQIEGDFRIRLSSLEPTVVNAEQVKKLLKYPKLCHHLHLSLQSGSDNVLKLMERRYDRAEYMQIVRVLKEADPCYGISTDIIAGFPQECEEDFSQSLRMIEEVGFCKVHAFKYSIRNGTKAANMQGQIAAEVKGSRVAALIKAGDLAADKFYTRNMDTVRRVLIEEYDEKNHCYVGYTDNYIRTYVEFCGNINQGDVLNNFYQVKLVSSFADGMRGTAIYPCPDASPLQAAHVDGFDLI